MSYSLSVNPDIDMDQAMETLCLSPTSAQQWAEALQTFSPQEQAAMLNHANELHANRQLFDELLMTQGLSTIPIEGDGNCLFRAISFIIYGTDEYYQLIRYYVCIYVKKYPAKCFQSHSPPSAAVEAYVNKMSQDKEWGDEIAIRAVSALYERPVKVYISDGEGGITVHPEFPGIANSGSEDVDTSANNEILLANFSGVSHFNALENSRTDFWRLSSPVGRFEELRLT